MTDSRVCIGAFAGAHGVRGGVRLKSFTAESSDIASYGPLENEAGTTRYEIQLTGEAKGLLTARVKGISDRDAALALKGVRLYVDRARFPEPEEEEYYHTDLVGLVVELPDGTPFGKVKSVADHGAGDILEIVRPDAPAVLTPFTLAAVPLVDIAGGRIIYDPPEEIDGEAPEGAGEGDVKGDD